MTLPSSARGAARASSPTARPQLDVPVQLNVNENPYGPSPACVADIAASVARGGGDAQPLPRPRVRRAARRAGGLPRRRHRRRRVTAEQVWAANGSNEVMLQLLQAFGGPGRTALSFAPTYSMYPEYARDTMTDLGRRAAARRTSRSTSTPPAPWSSEQPPQRGAAAQPQQPDRHRAAARGGRRAVRGRGVVRAGWHRRGRRGLRRVPPRRHPERAGPAARRTATWWSPAP